MIIYKVPHREINGDLRGFSHHLLKSEAKKAFKEKGADENLGDEVEELELAMNKHDIIRFLNQNYSYPDNG